MLNDFLCEIQSDECDLDGFVERERFIDEMFFLRLQEHRISTSNCYNGCYHTVESDEITQEAYEDYYSD